MAKETVGDMIVRHRLEEMARHPQTGGGDPQAVPSAQHPEPDVATRSLSGHWQGA